MCKISGHFPPHEVVKEALHEAIKNEKFSYGETRGNLKARQAVAEYCKHMGNVTADDVFLTTGCSMAFEVAVRTLANPGKLFKKILKN
jgi:aspartate/methionine/tyrosine aminotransferase